MERFDGYLSIFKAGITKGWETTLSEQDIGCKIIFEGPVTANII